VPYSQVFEEVSDFVLEVVLVFVQIHQVTEIVVIQGVFCFFIIFEAPVLTAHFTEFIKSRCLRNFERSLKVFVSFAKSKLLSNLLRHLDSYFITEDAFSLQFDNGHQCVDFDFNLFTQLHALDLGLFFLFFSDTVFFLLAVFAPHGAMLFKALYRVSI
jgi:hypothetical protein